LNKLVYPDLESQILNLRRLIPFGLFMGFLILVHPNSLMAWGPVRGYYKNLLSFTDSRNNYKNLGLTSKNTLIDDYQRLRLKAEHNHNSHGLIAHYEVRTAWGDTVRVRRQVESAGTSMLSGLADVLSFNSRSRFMDLEHESVRRSNFTLNQGWDRFQYNFTQDSWDMRVGRQAVTWGTGLIWTPTDLFVAFSPDEVDRDEKPGVDVVRFLLYPDKDTSLDLVAEPLKKGEPYEAVKEDSSLVLRAKTHVGEYDVSVLGGWVEEDAIVGGDFVGYLINAGFRGEWTQTWVEESAQRNYFRGLIGLDYSFQAMFEPYLALEYFYNGLGESDPDQYLTRLAVSSVARMFTRGTAFNIGRHYGGVVFALTISPLTRFQSQTVVNLTDGSAQEFATLSHSVMENTDLILGANVGLGPLGTEFGGWSQKQAGVDFGNPDLYSLYLKYYF